MPSGLEKEIRRIYERSPLYGRRFPLHADPLQWSCYTEIPALAKKDIVENGHQAFFADYNEIERGFVDKRFEYESTSGTTSGPMTVIMEEGWWKAQTERAYLASPILVFQIYVTTRDREAMPLLRYHTGDIVERRSTGFRILGREGSIYFRADGSLVSAGDVDEALLESFACWHWSLVQTGETRWDFHYVADETAAHREIESALGRLLGGGARVNAFRRKLIAPAASGKFSLLKPLAK